MCMCVWPSCPLPHRRRPQRWPTGQESSQGGLMPPFAGPDAPDWPRKLLTRPGWPLRRGAGRTLRHLSVHGIAIQPSLWHVVLVSMLEYTYNIWILADYQESILAITHVQDCLSLSCSVRYECVFVTWNSCSNKTSVFLWALQIKLCITVCLKKKP